MDVYLYDLADNPLFYEISADTISDILACADARVANYTKGELLIAEQDEVSDIGIILSGEAQASMLDQSGKRFILAELSKGSVFGDVMAASNTKRSHVTVTAITDVKVMLIPFRNAVGLQTADNRLLLNLFNVVSRKYFELQERINCIIKPTLREKILFYLNSVSERECRGMFHIPFSREGLAEYLNADRSALSRELSAMKRDGLIDYYKNTFRLL